MTTVQQEALILENGHAKGLSWEMRHGRTAHNMSSSSLRKKSDLTLVSKVKWCLLRNLLVNFQEVILGTKLSIIFLAIPFAVVAKVNRFGEPWVFALSLLGLTPLAERLSFLTEMDLDFNLLETGSLALAILVASFTLQDGTSHYMKGVVLLFCYVVIGACFFVRRTPPNQADVPNMILKSTTEAAFRA